jgi:hypothetical protein
MRLRRRAKVGNGPEPLLSLRSAVILGASVIVAIAAGVLAYLASHSPPGAFLAAGSACAGSLTILNTLIGPD